jgi:hypothetical protein
VSAKDDDFEAFWHAYPTRGRHPNPKKPAHAKFEAAVRKGADPAAIIRGAEAYADHVRRDAVNPRFVAQAVTWLSQERWKDIVEQPPEEDRPQAGMC